MSESKRGVCQSCGADRWKGEKHTKECARKQKHDAYSAHPVGFEEEKK